MENSLSESSTATVQLTVQEAITSEPDEVEVVEPEEESEDKGLFGLAMNWYWLMMLGLLITARRVRVIRKS